MLSQTTVYALRALATLAGLQPGESIRGLDLSARTGIPRQYLAKVMGRLVHAGLVRARRGRGGGFALRRPPRQVHVADVLAATDDTFETGQCVFGYGACDTDRPCALHPIWSRLSQSVASWAEGMTLGDLGPMLADPKRTRTGRRGA